MMLNRGPVDGRGMTSFKSKTHSIHPSAASLTMLSSSLRLLPIVMAPGRSGTEAEKAPLSSSQTATGYLMKTRVDRCIKRY